VSEQKSKKKNHNIIQFAPVHGLGPGPTCDHLRVANLIGIEIIIRFYTSIHSLFIVFFVSVYIRYTCVYQVGVPQSFFPHNRWSAQLKMSETLGAKHIILGFCLLVDLHTIYYRTIRMRNSTGEINRFAPRKRTTKKMIKICCRYHCTV